MNRMGTTGGGRMSRVGAAMLAVGLAASASAVGCGPAARLSAADVVAKNVAARGGLEAWRRIETMVWTGRVESAHAPMPSMPFRLEQKRPNRSRLEISTVGHTSVRVFNGRHGWKLRPARGRPAVLPYEPQELKFAQAGHGIDGPLLDYAAKGTSVTLEGVDEIGGRQAYRLSVSLGTGGSERVWVDTETYLELRYDRMAEGQDGSQRRVSVTYGDYRTVDGVKVAFLIATGGEPGTTPDRMLIDSVALNAPLDDSTFDDPAAARSRNRARSSFASRAPAAAVRDAHP